MPSKAVVIVLASFLLVILIYSSVAQFDVFARKKITTLQTCYKSNADKPGATSADVCCTLFYTNGILTSSLCQKCNYDSGGNKIDCRNYNTRVGQTGVLNPPAGATTALPPSGNNTGTPGKTSIFNPVRNVTSALPVNNNTGNPIAMTSSDNPPGCSKKVPIPPNCTLNPFNNSASNKGTASLGNIVKAPVNHTNALPTGNNTSTQPPALKLSQPSLAGQQTQTQQTTGHHHEGSNTGASTSTGNSTGH